MLRMACGTPAYTAPEVVARRGYDGAVADAWSCGVILFVLLAGYLSFGDSNLLAMYKKINRRDYQFPSFVSKPARSLIYQLLDPNPKRDREDHEHFLFPEIIATTEKDGARKQSFSLVLSG